MGLQIFFIVWPLPNNENVYVAHKPTFWQQTDHF